MRSFSFTGVLRTRTARGLHAHGLDTHILKPTGLENPFRHDGQIALYKRHVRNFSFTASYGRLPASVRAVLKLTRKTQARSGRSQQIVRAMPSIIV
jgi:hypothetical protein